MVSTGFFREKIRLVDLTIWGTPAKSSTISNPRAKTANAAMAPSVAALGATKRRLKIPIMPNSWTPAPAGVMGTNASAVTNGWIRKNPSQAIAKLLLRVIPKAAPRKYHSKPFRIQQIIVNPKISGIAERV